MQRKTIQATIYKKVKSWVGSLPEDLQKMRPEDRIIISGGAIASMFLGEEVNDYDIYFTDMEIAYAIADYYARLPSMNREVYVGKHTGHYDDEDIPLFEPRSSYADRVHLFIPDGGIFKPAGESLWSFRPTVFTDNAITLKDDVQLILRFVGDPEYIHSNFDFVHCTNYWRRGELITNAKALESLLSRRLYYIGSKYPFASIVRTRKFLKRGWNISAGEYLKMAFQVSELDMRDPQVLAEQLTGVDLAYFLGFIQRMTTDVNLVEDSFGYDYLSTIIDEVFEGQTFVHEED